MNALHTPIRFSDGDFRFHCAEFRDGSKFLYRVRVDRKPLDRAFERWGRVPDCIVPISDPALIDAWIAVHPYHQPL